MITEEFIEKVHELVSTIKGLVKVSEIYSKFYKDDDCKEVFQQYVSFDEESLNAEHDNALEKLFSLFKEAMPTKEAYIDDLAYEFISEPPILFGDCMLQRLEDTVENLLAELE